MNTEVISALGSPLLRTRNAFMATISDRVVQALLFGMLLIAVIDTSQLLPGIEFTVDAFVGMLPFFLLALAMAAFTRAAGADAVIARLFEGKPLVSIFLASGFGAVSPFCSCGVIPVIAALLAARVPLAPVMAFWIASPIIDPEMFILTAAGISTEFAIAKTAAAASMGLLAGFVIYAFSYTGYFDNPMKQAVATGCGQSSGTGTCEGSEKPRVAWRFWRESARIAVFRGEFIRTGLFLGKWLLLAFFLESLMLAYIPPQAVADAVGGNGWYVIPLSAVVGVPAYLNGYAAIPLVSGLMDLGMAPGAALAFITAGAVSSVPAAMAVYALVRPPVFLLYLLLGLVSSMLAGATYQLYLSNAFI